MVDSLRHQLLVAGNRRRRNDDRIAGNDCHFAVLTHSHARQRRHRLALTARRDDDNLIRRIEIDLVDVDNRAFRRGNITHLKGDRDHVHHAAAQHGDLSLVAHRRVDDLLDAVDVRGKRGDDNALLRVMKRFVKRRADRALAGRMPLALRVGTVRQH